MVDISWLAQFKWYDWVLYNEPTASFPEDTMRLGHYLGPTPPGERSMMQGKILNENGQEITCVTFWTLALVERDQWSEEMHIFDEKIHLMYGPKASDDDLCAIKATTSAYDKVKEGLVMPNTDIFDTEGYDGYIASQILLPKGDEYQFCKIESCKKDEKGNLTGCSDSNPILDTRLYEVEFDDGEVCEYAANMIAESLYSQIDEEGFQQVLMDEIIDHRREKHAVTKENGFVEIKGKCIPKKTTQGWKFCIKWKDGQTSWEQLSDLKEGYPVKTTEYASSKDLS